MYIYVRMCIYIYTQKYTLCMCVSYTCIHHACIALHYMHCISLHDVTWHHMTWHSIISHHIRSHYIISHRFASHHVIITYITYITNITYITYITFMSYQPTPCHTMTKHYVQQHQHSVTLDTHMHYIHTVSLCIYTYYRERERGCTRACDNYICLITIYAILTISTSIIIRIILYVS